MITLSTELIAELGFSALTQNQARELLGEMHTTLETLVGSRLASKVPDDELEAFERLIDANDERGATEWLNVKVPDYRQIVRDTLDEITNSLRNIAAQGDAVPENLMLSDAPISKRGGSL